VDVLPNACPTPATRQQVESILDTLQRAILLENGK